ncbi:arylsulfatase B-like isoform X1 [Ptychodera flava]|uniref:arylsulfatase B-like isoform X1 n=1 Tax=Ptychodera flava TaxID=63121 RepID=UPI00396AA750
MRRLRSVCLYGTTLLCVFFLSHLFVRFGGREKNDVSKKYVPTQRESRESGLPNIVFIMADDLGWGDVGYHDSIIKTPNIDRLASEGVKLENYYGSTWCAPSRLNLMTGRYRIHTGLYGDVCDFMALSETTVAEKLREAGYYTALVGKWHLGGFYNTECNPPQRGFDTFFGYLGGCHGYYTHRRGGPRAKYDLFANDTAVGPDYEGQYSTFIFTKEAQRIVEQHSKRPTEQPLFLYLSYQAVHTPLEVPEEYENIYKNVIEDDDRRIYAAMTTCMDEAIGNVTETLKSTGLWENTVLIFSSDNGATPSGGGSNWPLRGHKGVWYEGGIRLVSFVTSPLLTDQVKGTVNNELIHMTDWFKTMLYLAKGNLKGTKPLDGYNQWETISMGKTTDRKEILHNLIPGDQADTEGSIDGFFDRMPFATLRVGKWKLLTGNIVNEGSWTKPAEMGFHIYGPGNHGSIELYNIEEDPEERNNLAQTNTVKLRELYRTLQRYSATINKDVLQVEPVVE